jgi:DNA ligase D-like protein (predicted 3'-phosphoesterase)
MIDPAPARSTEAKMTNKPKAKAEPAAGKSVSKVPKASTPLSAYQRKRDFKKSPEPAGGANKATAYPIFVIQKHDASSLHYDLRLEVDGTLKSWAVPKGPAPDPAEKHLAVHVEDHPIEYADFEGVIPEGEYGGGTVMVWDRGVYLNLREAPGKTHPTTMTAALAEGKIEIWLEGTKLKGGYALIRTRLGGADKNWLLFKMKDQLAGAGRDDRGDDAKSALTGRTMDQIAAEGGGKVKHRK